MAELEKVEHPKPNLEFLESSFTLFAQHHPWVSRESLHPKSVVREIIESCQSFSGYVKEYGLARSEGALLRYLSEVYKTLVQTVPERARTPEVEDLIASFGALVRGVDSSLIDEWERLRDPSKPRQALDDSAEEADPGLSDRTLTTLTRNLLFSFLRALANRDFESALDLVESGEVSWTPPDLERAARPLLEESTPIQLDAQGRSPANTGITHGSDYWQVTQNVVLEGEVSEYTARGRLDVARSRAERRAVFLLDHVG